jgi:hypothetical protein
MACFSAAFRPHAAALGFNLDVEKRDAEGLNYERLAICRGSP